jgi:hypothetical protein
MRVAGLHPAQCRAELIPSNGGRSLPACCGARLDQARRGLRADTGLIALQARILDLLRPDGPVSTLSAGLPAPPVRYFADLRALALLACSTWPAARPLSPSEETASAVDEHVTAINREAGKQPRVRPGTPPMDAAASGCLAHIADQILAGNPDEVREQLKLFLPAGRWKESPAYWGLRAVRSATPCSEGLYTAYAPLLWGFSKAGSRPATGRRNAAIHPQRWGPENIPAFLPEDWYSRHFMPLTDVSPRFIRRTAALKLVQMAAGGSLGEAAGFLGIASTDKPWSGKSRIYTVTARVRTAARQQAPQVAYQRGQRVAGVPGRVGGLLQRCALIQVDAQRLVPPLVHLARAGQQLPSRTWGRYGGHVAGLPQRPCRPAMAGSRTVMRIVCRFAAVWGDWSRTIHSERPHVSFRLRPSDC